MQGQAIDIRIAYVPLAKLRYAALPVRRGGVGYYPASDFVHVDTGRLRTWSTACVHEADRRSVSARSSLVSCPYISSAKRIVPSSGITTAVT